MAMTLNRPNGINLQPFSIQNVDAKGATRQNTLPYPITPVCTRSSSFASSGTDSSGESEEYKITTQIVEEEAPAEFSDTSSDDWDLELGNCVNEGWKGGIKKRRPLNGVLSNLLMLYGPGPGLENYNTNLPVGLVESSGSLASDTKIAASSEDTEKKQGADGKVLEALSDEEAGWKSFSRHPRWRGRVPESGSEVEVSDIGRSRRGMRQVSSYIRNLGRLERQDELKITVHISELLERQNYFLNLARSLLQFGAPPHRIEPLLSTTASILSLPASVVHLPSIILISFLDPSTQTSSLHIIKSPTALDLGTLHHVHTIFKCILHDTMSLPTAIKNLNSLFRKPPLRNKYFKVLLFASASASIAPLFGARLIDLPASFFLGMLTAILTLLLAPKDPSYSNILEVTAAILISFFARALGSIRLQNGTGTENYLFCFSAITQSAIAPLLLPGYAILLGALEIQSKNLIPGAVRMFYAIIYSFLLWFGITIGTTFYDLLDPSATTSLTCSNNNNVDQQQQQLRDYKFFFVISFLFCVSLANQARWRQVPMMIVVGVVGYTVSFFTSERFTRRTMTPQVGNAAASVVIGVIGNGWGRWSGQAGFMVVVPGILLLVQSGIASEGSLMSGLAVAIRILRQGKDDEERVGGGGLVQAVVVDGGAGNLALGLVAVSVAISFGLFLSTVIVYPLGKGKGRSATFAF